MSTELMKRYTNEILKDSSLYERYLDGRWYPNIDDYNLFVRKLSKNNLSFAKTIERYNLIKKNDFILETVLSDIYSVSEHLNKEHILIESTIGKIRVNPDYSNLINYNTCYISNGIYNETSYFINQLLSHGSFIVGICDNKDSLNYKNNIVKIELLKKELDKKHVKYKIYKHNNHRDNSYILYSRRSV